jgi:hypothetical protein
VELQSLQVVGIDFFYVFAVEFAEDDKEQGWKDLSELEVELLSSVFKVANKFYGLNIFSLAFDIKFKYVFLNYLFDIVNLK